MNNTNEKPYEKFGTGLVIVKSKDSNFNSDFTGTPRRLPDEEGTIYATDKALKYTIRKHLKDTDEKVFGWRRKLKEDKNKRKKGDPLKIEENYKRLFEQEDSGLPDRTEILENLLKCTDVRLFGVTFAPGEDGKNVSITGPIQISYGMNKFEENLHYSNQILSPYQPKGSGSTTIGEEAKALESHYVYDFTVNPNHIKEALEHIESKDDFQLLSKDDIESFKEAARKGATGIDSTTMVGTENELLLYAESQKPINLQNLKQFVNIDKSEESDKTKIKMGTLINYLHEMLPQDRDNSVEIYYDPYKTEVQGIPESNKKEGISITEYNIITGSELE